MTRWRWPLNRALEFLQRMRPEAAPNAGYLAALLRLEEELFGRQTVKVKLGGIGLDSQIFFGSIWRFGMCVCVLLEEAGCQGEGCGVGVFAVVHGDGHVLYCIPTCCVLHLQCSAKRRPWRGQPAGFALACRPTAHPLTLTCLLRLPAVPAHALLPPLSLQMKKTKPEPRSCPECGERVGLSAAAVRVHIKLKHPGSLLARWVGGGAGRVGGQGGCVGGPRSALRRRLCVLPPRSTKLA
jgi:hypothetical protein